jgi:hypothetical protein
MLNRQSPWLIRLLLPPSERSAPLSQSRERRKHVLSIVNGRESNIVMGTLVGPEIGAISTETFTLPAGGSPGAFPTR